MSIDAHVSAGERTQELPPEPRMLTWREGVRERKAQERELRALIRRFGRGR